MKLSFKKRTRVFIFWVSILILHVLGLTCLFAEDIQKPEPGISIIVHETTRVTQSQIVLGDIADIQAQGFLKEALEKIVISPSPKPDKIKSLDRKKILHAIQGERYLPEDIRIDSPDRIYVKRRSQIISKQDIQQVVQKHLNRIFKNRDYQLIDFSVRGLEIYPWGKIEYQLDTTDLIDDHGRLSCSLDVRIDGIREDRVSISGTIALYEPVLHAKRIFLKGDRLSGEDVFLKKENIFELGNDYIKTIDTIDGKIFSSAVSKGDVIKTSLLAESPLVKKGDIITLIARNENLVIVTSGISKEDGFENKQIQVENLTSGRIVRGIVKGRSKVEVVY